MKSKERLDYIIEEIKKQIGDHNQALILIDKNFIELLENIREDLEILDLFKKYFSGVLQEESGRLFIDMNELEEGDLAVFLKLFKEQVEEQE